MLRNVGGRYLQGGLKIGNRKFALGEQVQHAKTGGVREGLADLHLHLEDLIIDLAFCCFWHHPLSPALYNNSAVFRYFHPKLRSEPPASFNPPQPAPTSPG